MSDLFTQHFLNLLAPTKEQEKGFIEELVNEIDMDDHQVEKFFQLWAEKKSANPVMQSIFRDSLAVSVPINFASKNFNKAFDEIYNMKSIYSDLFACLPWGNANIVRDFVEEEKDRYCSAYRDKAVKPFLVTRAEATVKSPYCTNMLLARRWFEYVSQETDKQLTLKDNERFYRFIGRLLKRFDKFNLEDNVAFDDENFFTMYNNYLQMLSKHKKRFINSRLILSIHPADFMSQSDNAESWSSCVSIEGDYSSSTTGRALSPDTLIAYIVRQEDNNDLFTIRNYSWNSKLWRTVVCLNKESLVTFGGYPFGDDAINERVVNLINTITGSSYEKTEDGFSVYNYAGTRDQVRDYYSTKEEEERNDKTLVSLVLAEYAFFFDTGQQAEFRTDGVLFSWQNHCCDNCGEHFAEPDYIEVRIYKCPNCECVVDEHNHCDCGWNPNSEEALWEEVREYEGCPNCGAEA